MNKQTTLETFIVSAGTKLQTNIQTKKKVLKPRTQGVRKQEDLCQEGSRKEEETKNAI